MNKAILVGRLTRDPEMRTTQSGISVVSFTVAVDRRFKNQSGEREADFISCRAWRQTAEFIQKYFSSVFSTNTEFLTAIFYKFLICW